MKFRTRLILLFGGLLIISLVMLLWSIDRIARSAAITGIERDLSNTVDTLEKLHRQRVTNLQQNLRLLAGDYGFKSAYASEDEPTIRSALVNHQYRLADANLMAICDLDGQVLSNTYRSSLNGSEFPWPELLVQADLSESGETAAFGVFDDAVYQFIVTPLLAPDIEAWVISGFRLDDETARRFAGITGSQITFFRFQENRPVLVASSLGPIQQVALQQYLQEAEFDRQARRYVSGEEMHIGHFLRLDANTTPGITAFVERSLDKAMAPYRKMSGYVLWIFIGSMIAILLLIFVLAGRVTRSLTNLSQAAREIAGGHLDTRVEVAGNDEFGLLSRTFNDMSQGLEEKEQVRDLLGKVVSPEIAGKLLSEGVELGGEEREVTVLFCDIQGFTRLSETRPPTEILAALNYFFSAVSGIIESHGGVVDKYIGDAVMALFGAPQDDVDHAQRALECGLELSAAADDLLAQLNAEQSVGCNFGIGIHSGTVVAGNVGSATRLNYTVIGDTVNVASRVEGQTRVFDARLIVTQATVDRCEQFNFEKLGSVQLKGRSQEIDLYSCT